MRTVKEFDWIKKIGLADLLVFTFLAAGYYYYLASCLIFLFSFGRLLYGMLFSLPLYLFLILAFLCFRETGRYLLAARIIVYAISTLSLCILCLGAVLVYYTSGSSHSAHGLMSAFFITGMASLVAGLAMGLYMALRLYLFRRYKRSLAEA